MIRNYLSITWKVLMRRKFFTFVSLFGVSFTLLVLSIAVAFLDHSFSHLTPESNFDRVMYSTDARLSSKDNNWRSSLGYQTIKKYYLPLATQMPEAIETISIFDNSSPNTVFHRGQKIKFNLRRTDGHYFKIVNLDFLEGKPFTQEDEENGQFVAVINQAVKKQYFGEETALDKDLAIDGRRFRVVGVVANVADFRKVAFADVWAPISTNKSSGYRNAISRNSDLLGRFNFAVMAKETSFLPTVKQAVLAANQSVEIPNIKDFGTFQTTVRTHFEHFAAENDLTTDWDNYYTKEFTGQMTALLLVATLVFMLLPSLNLINLNLSRMMERASEVGVRRAFGAPISSLMQQFIIENVLLSIVGGILGLFLSALALAALNHSNLFAYANFTLNYRIFAIGFVLALAFGLLSGVYPAWRMARLHPVAALKGGHQ